MDGCLVLLDGRANEYIHQYTTTSFAAIVTVKSCSQHDWTLSGTCSSLKSTIIAVSLSTNLCCKDETPKKIVSSPTAHCLTLPMLFAPCRPKPHHVYSSTCSFFIYSKAHTAFGHPMHLKVTIIRFITTTPCNLRSSKRTECSLNPAHLIVVAQAKPQLKDQMRVVLPFKIATIYRPKYACLT